MPRKKGVGAAIDWLVFSTDQIEHAAKVIKDFEGEQTVDAMGLGIYFENTADSLFPGTSTLHNWLRYKFFITSILFAISQMPVKKGPSKELLRKLEVDLQKRLVETAQKKGYKTTGIHGYLKGEALKTFPSRLYWNGINVIGLFGDHGIALADLLDQLDYFRGIRSNNFSSEIDEASEAEELPFATEVPKFAEDIFSNIELGEFKKDLWLDLAPSETAWYLERLEEKFPHSFATYLNSKFTAATALRAAEIIFDIKLTQQASPLADLFTEAERYSRFIQGSNYLYNLILSQHINTQSDTEITQSAVNGHLKNLCDWRKNNGDLHGWCIRDITTALNLFNSKNPSPSKIAVAKSDDEHFVNRLKAALFSSDSELKIAKEMKDIVLARETKIKGRERTRFSERIRKPQYIATPPEYSDYMFNYRWGQGKSNALDLLKAKRK